MMHHYPFPAYLASIGAKKAGLSPRLIRLTRRMGRSCKTAAETRSALRADVVRLGEHSR
jgi:hypothetical protein